MKHTPLLRRPALRFAPRRGWTNDPNGLLHDGKQYHLFAQYNPDDIVWGPMHWLHAVSGDMLHWRELGVALAPDELGTIFSGSAVIDEHNTAGFGAGAIVAIYTSHGDSQQQCIAYSPDGVDFTPYEGNPVIPYSGKRGFRDPKVLRNAADDSWILTVSAIDHIEFYRSANLREWEKTGEFGLGLLEDRQIYECPDLFELAAPDGRPVWVLLASIGAPPEMGGGRVRYFLGDFDGDSFQETINPHSLKWIDSGFDNYAAVTFYGTDDRTLIGWAANPAYAGQLPADGYRGAMTLPRVLRIKLTSAGLRLASVPIELPGGDWVDAQSGSALPDGAFELLLTADGPFTVTLSNSSGEAFAAGLDIGNHIFADRTNAGADGFDEWFAKPPFQRTSVPRNLTGAFQMRVIVDGDLIECFADEGVFVCAARVFPSEAYATLEIAGRATAQLRTL